MAGEAQATQSIRDDFKFLQSMHTMSIWETWTWTSGSGRSGLTSIYLRMVQRSARAALEDGTKHDFLCANLGMEGLRIMSTNPAYARLDVQEGNPISYPEFAEAAMDHFAPRVSPCVFEFQKRKQEADETVDEYLTALRILATVCRFGVQAERNLMPQLVEGCVSKKTQQER